MTLMTYQIDFALSVAIALKACDMHKLLMHDQPTGYSVAIGVRNPGC